MRGGLFYGTQIAGDIKDGERKKYRNYDCLLYTSDAADEL